MSEKCHVVVILICISLMQAVKLGGFPNIISYLYCLFYGLTILIVYSFFYERFLFFWSFYYWFIVQNSFFQTFDFLALSNLTKIKYLKFNVKFTKVTKLLFCAFWCFVLYLRRPPLPQDYKHCSSRFSSNYDKLWFLTFSPLTLLEFIFRVWVKVRSK